MNNIHNTTKLFFKYFLTNYTEEIHDIFYDNNSIDFFPNNSLDIQEYNREKEEETENDNDDPGIGIILVGGRENSQNGGDNQPNNGSDRENTNSRDTQHTNRGDSSKHYGYVRTDISHLFKWIVITGLS